MTDRLRYYIDLLAALCGFDSPETVSTFGILFVVFATIVLIYAFYRAVLLTLWPGERNADHIKWRVLDEEGPSDAH